MKEYMNACVAEKVGNDLTVEERNLISVRPPRAPERLCPGKPRRVAAVARLACLESDPVVGSARDRAPAA